MSESIHQWILKDLTLYAEDWGPRMSRNLMKPPKGRKCQLVEFISPPTDDASAAIWGYVSDKECWIPVKFESHAISLFEKLHTDHGPFRSYLGSIITLKKITLLFTKVPKEGERGLSENDHLVLQVGEVVFNGSRGEPAFHMDDVDKKGIRKRKVHIAPEDDPAIGKWARGLRTGNGHVLQMERLERNRRTESDAAGAGAFLSSPSTPRLSKSRNTLKERSTVSELWDIPADQKEIIKRYQGRGPPTPGSDVFSDEGDEKSEGEESQPLTRANSPNLEWSSTPVRAPADDVDTLDDAAEQDQESNSDDQDDASETAAIGKEGNEDAEDEDEDGEDEDGNDETINRAFFGNDIPCAQPPKSSSTFGFTFDSVGAPKGEPVTQAIPPSAVPSNEATQAVRDLPLSCSTFPSTLSKESQTAEYEQNNKVSQVSSITTIEPTSSNEVSCSAQIPPAQPSLAKLDESQESCDSDAIIDSSPESCRWDVQSQFSDLGDIGEVTEEDDVKEEEEVEEAIEEELIPVPPRHEDAKDAQDSLEDPAPGSPEIPKQSSPLLPRQREPGNVFDDNTSSSVVPVSRRVLSRLDGLNYKTPDRTTLMPAPLRLKEARVTAKRCRSEIESSAGGPIKRLKFNQTGARDELVGLRSKAPFMNPQTSEPFPNNHKSASKDAPSLSDHPAPSLLGTGKLLTHWPSLQKAPPQLPRSPLPGISTARPSLLALKKMKLGERRSNKYRVSHDQ